MLSPQKILIFVAISGTASSDKNLLKISTYSLCVPLIFLGNPSHGLIG